MGRFIKGETLVIAMVFVNRTLGEMLDKIKFTHLGLYEIVIPEKNGQFEGGYTRPNSKLYHEIRQAVKERTGRSLDGFLNESIANAMGRGNQNTTYLPVSFKLFFGEKGIVFRMRDSGEGFDYTSKIRQLRSGEKYFQNSGAGLAMLEKSPFEASYEGNGNILNICIST